MIKLTRAQWEKIPADYKFTWTNPDSPELVGKKSCFLGSIKKNGGTALAFEGMHFEIITEQESK